MTFLTDPTPGFYAVLILAALFLGGVAFRYRTRTTKLLAGVVLALLILVFLIDFFIDSPREQSVRKVSAMIDAINARNTAGLLSHVSESFDFKGRKKSQLGAAQLWNNLRTFQVNVRASDFSRDYVQTPDGNSISIGFLATAEAEGRPMPLHIQVTFVRDPDGQFRVRTFTAHDPLQKTKGSEIQLPGLP
jgi:hypothetical protein